MRATPTLTLQVTLTSVPHAAAWHCWPRLQAGLALLPKRQVRCAAAPFQMQGSTSRPSCWTPTRCCPPAPRRCRLHCAASRRPERQGQRRVWRSRCMSAGVPRPRHAHGGWQRLGHQAATVQATHGAACCYASGQATLGGRPCLETVNPSTPRPPPSLHPVLRHVQLQLRPCGRNSCKPRLNCRLLGRCGGQLGDQVGDGVQAQRHETV